jgi:dihydrofolate reductase
VKIVHYMGLMANGCYAVVDESIQSERINLDEALPKEVSINFAQTASKFGNLIIGRHTFELFGSHMSGIETVVMSHSPLKYDGVSVVASPAEALNVLEKKGFDTALVGGELN